MEITVDTNYKVDTKALLNNNVTISEFESITSYYTIDDECRCIYCDKPLATKVEENTTIMKCSCEMAAKESALLKARKEALSKNVMPTIIKRAIKTFSELEAYAIESKNSLEKSITK